MFSLVLILNLKIFRGGAFCFKKVLASKITCNTGSFHSNLTCTSFLILWCLMETTFHLKTEANGREGFKTCKEGNKLLRLLLDVCLFHNFAYYGRQFF